MRSALRSRVDFNFTSRSSHYLQGSHYDEQSKHHVAAATDPFREAFARWSNASSSIPHRRRVQWAWWFAIWSTEYIVATLQRRIANFSWWDGSNVTNASVTLALQSAVPTSEPHATAPNEHSTKWSPRKWFLSCARSLEIRHDGTAVSAYE